MLSLCGQVHVIEYQNIYFEHQIICISTYLCKMTHHSSRCGQCTSGMLNIKNIIGLPNWHIIANTSFAFLKRKPSNRVKIQYLNWAFSCTYLYSACQKKDYSQTCLDVCMYVIWSVKTSFIISRYLWNLKVCQQCCKLEVIDFWAHWGPYSRR